MKAYKAHYYYLYKCTINDGITGETSYYATKEAIDDYDLMHILIDTDEEDYIKFVTINGHLVEKTQYYHGNIVSQIKHYHGKIKKGN